MTRLTPAIAPAFCALGVGSAMADQRCNVPRLENAFPASSHLQ